VILAGGCAKKTAEPEFNEFNLEDVYDKEFLQEIARLQAERNQKWKDDKERKALEEQERLKRMRAQESPPEKAPWLKEDIPADSLEPLLTDFLSEYFQNNDYVLWEPPLDVHSRKIHIAVHYIKKFHYDVFYREIFDRAIGFEITDEGIVPYLYVKDFQFINKDGTVFIDLRKAFIARTRELFGFMFYYSIDISGVKPSGLGIDTYFNNGNGVADSFVIYWNEDDKVFEDRAWWE
jgi:hypothetical protein